MIISVESFLNEALYDMLVATAISPDGGTGLPREHSDLTMRPLGLRVGAFGHNSGQPFEAAPARQADSIQQFLESKMLVLIQKIFSGRAISGDFSLPGLDVSDLDTRLGVGAPE